MKTEERIKRLPVWAQNRIRVIEQDRDWFRGQILEMTGDCDTTTDTRIVRYTDGDIRLPVGSRIEFNVSGGTIQARTAPPDGEGTTRLIVTGSGRILIRPVAANAIEICVDAR